MERKRFRSLSVAARQIGPVLAGLTLAASASAQTYPDRPIRFIIPFPAGGAGDAVVRVVGQKLTEVWGQPTVLEIRSGASGAIGLQATAKSAPDGYTLALGTASTHAINPILQPNLSYDPVKDFAPVAMLIEIPNIITGNSAVPANNLKELIQLARSKPGSLSFASNGNGTSAHMAGELLNIVAGIKLEHIPYQGAAPAITNVLGGHVQILVGALATSLPHLATGRLKAYGVTSLKRAAVAPAVPTIAESGFPGFEVVQWFGIYAPAATPKDIVSKLNGEINRVLRRPDVNGEFTRQGYGVEPRTQEQFASYMKEEIVKWTKVIKEAGIHGD